MSLAVTEIQPLVLAQAGELNESAVAGILDQ
jgi:hypothetical protein